MLIQNWTYIIHMRRYKNLLATSQYRVCAIFIRRERPNNHRSEGNGTEAQSDQIR